jgi:hypothetical protein
MYIITFVRPIFKYTNFDRGLLPLPDLEIELTTGVTSQQGILTPPRHPIPPLVFPGVRVSLICTTDYSMHLIWALILSADLSVYLTGQLVLTADCSKS